MIVTESSFAFAGCGNFGNPIAESVTESFNFFGVVSSADATSVGCKTLFGAGCRSGDLFGFVIAAFVTVFYSAALLAFVIHVGVLGSFARQIIKSGFFLIICGKVFTANRALIVSSYAGFQSVLGVNLGLGTNQIAVGVIVGFGNFLVFSGKFLAANRAFYYAIVSAGFLTGCLNFVFFNCRTGYALGDAFCVANVAVVVVIGVNVGAGSLIFDVLTTLYGALVEVLAVFDCPLFGHSVVACNAARIVLIGCVCIILCALVAFGAIVPINIILLAIVCRRLKLVSYRISVGVTGSRTFGCATYGAGLGSFTGCILPIVTKSFAFGCVTYRTSLGSFTGCILPIVTKSIAFGYVTNGAGLRLGAGCINPSVLIISQRRNGALFYGSFNRTVNVGEDRSTILASVVFIVTFSCAGCSGCFMLGEYVRANLGESDLDKNRITGIS